MSFIDTDEYLVPTHKNTIVEAISHLDDYSNISLQYTIFGNNGHTTKPDQADIFAYTKKIANQEEKYKRFINTKCIVKPECVDVAHFHKFTTTDMGMYVVTENGNNIPYHLRRKPKYYSNEYLQLNHYYIRSDEEFQQKLKDRNYITFDNDPIINKLQEDQRLIDSGYINDESVKKFLALHGIHSADEFRNFVV